jgi:sec-independent protein translocase protein TatA
MSFPMFIGGLGGPELVIIFMLVVLLFGASKLPKLARASGEAMGEFQKGREEVEREIREATSLDSSGTDDADDAVDADAMDEYDVETDDDVAADSEVDTDRDAPSA